MLLEPLTIPLKKNIETYSSSYVTFADDDPCLSSPCRNGGACTSFNTYFTCSCINQFSGVTCEQGKLL